MAESNPVDVDTSPATHILDFFYDEEDACALTARINDVRFHIIVDTAKLKSTSKSFAQNTVFGEYKRRLSALRKQDRNGNTVYDPAETNAQNQRSQSDAGDSGVDVEGRTDTSGSTEDSGIVTDNNTRGNKSNTEADDESIDTDNENREISLQNWILSCFSQEVDRLAPKRDKHSHKSLYDWYNTPAAFFELTVQDSQLKPEDLEETPSLRKRLDDLLPSLPMPKYIRSLPHLPFMDPKDITVLTEAAHIPSSPVHPALVRTRLPDSKSPEEFFFKPVDPTQPSPTKREISLLHKIQSLGLNDSINVPRLHALVSSPPSDSNASSTTSIMGLLLTPIPTPATPLTELFESSSLSTSQRQRYADECNRILKVLHENEIIFGDAKGDNFLVDAEEQLWVIDFGGSYTEGWVDEDVAETKEGDKMGVGKVVDALLGKDEDEVEEGIDIDERGGEEADNDQKGSRRKRKRSERENEGDQEDQGKEEGRGQKKMRR